MNFIGGVIEGEVEDDIPIDDELYSPHDPLDDEAEKSLQQVDRQLGVMRCMYTQVREDDWRRTSIFHIYSRVGGALRSLLTGGVV